MKKIASALLIAGLSLNIGSVIAAGETIPGDGRITSAQCDLLRDDVRINNSANVVMAYNCDKANTRINVAACHKAGSQKPMTGVPCVIIGTDKDGNNVWNGTSCTATTDKTDINGRRIYTGSSTGGSVAQGSLDAADCTLGALNTNNLMK